MFRVDISCKTNKSDPIHIFLAMVRGFWSADTRRKKERVKGDEWWFWWEFSTVFISSAFFFIFTTLFFFALPFYFQCIQSRMIKLRVKRRSDSRLGEFPVFLFLSFLFSAAACCVYAFCRTCLFATLYLQYTFWEVVRDKFSLSRWMSGDKTATAEHFVCVRVFPPLSQPITIGCRRERGVED